MSKKSFYMHQLVKEKNEMEFRNHLENNRVKQIKGEDPAQIPMKVISENEIFALAEKLNEYQYNLFKVYKCVPKIHQIPSSSNLTIRLCRVLN